jgi:hypothetical protein
VSDPVKPDRLLQLGLGFRGSRVLLSAVEIGVFTELARQPADLATLSRVLGLHDRSARDFLDALVALRLLERQGGIYMNTAETERFLDRTKPTYIGGLLEMASTRLFPAWGSLTLALKTGRPDSATVPTGDTFEQICSDPKRLRTFMAGMSALSSRAARDIAEIFPWRNYRSFADIGTAQGMMPATISRSHPHLAAVGFDLAPVRPLFEEFIVAQGLSDRVTFCAGNFLSDPLPPADVLIMGHILHDWDLERKRALLASAYESLPTGGVLIVYETLIDDERRESAAGLLMSLNMLLVTSGGFDFSGADCKGWMLDAGFSRTEVRNLTGADSMILGFK